MRADVTVTFAPAKLGMCIHPGVDYTGKLCVTDITIPRPLWENLPFELLTFEKCGGSLRKGPPTPTREPMGIFSCLPGLRKKRGRGSLCRGGASHRKRTRNSGGSRQHIPGRRRENNGGNVRFSQGFKGRNLPSRRARRSAPELEGKKTALAVGPGISTSRSTGKFLKR